MLFALLPVPPGPPLLGEHNSDENIISSNSLPLLSLLPLPTPSPPSRGGCFACLGLTPPQAVVEPGGACGDDFGAAARLPLNIGTKQSESGSESYIMSKGDAIFRKFRADVPVAPPLLGTRVDAAALSLILLLLRPGTGASFCLAFDLFTAADIALSRVSVGFSSIAVKVGVYQVSLKYLCSHRWPPRRQSASRGRTAVERSA